MLCTPLVLADGKLKPVADDAPARIDEWPLIVFHIPERAAGDSKMTNMGEVVIAAVAAAKAADDEPTTIPGASRGLKELRDTFKAGYIHARADHGSRRSSGVELELSAEP